jgi:3-hydroxybutyryl-CoA dehydrogenase
VSAAAQPRRIAVIGLGTMGHGIAQTFAVAGHTVVGWDEHPAARASLKDRIASNLADFADAGLFDPARAEEVLARVHVAASEADAVRDATFVTEAVAEDLAVKQALFPRLEAATGPDTILASNSSTFPISQSGAGLLRPERAVVTHWFNPPHIIPTVEVVAGPQTSEATMQTTLGLLRGAGKLAIRIDQELPGFLVNRVQIAIMREVWDLLDRGVASAEDIDDAIRGSFGLRLAAFGPLRVHDFGGMDINRAVYQSLTPDIASGTTVPGVVDRMVDAGHYGFKTGKGFYDYPESERDAVRSERDRRYLALVKLLHHDSGAGE